MMILLGYRLTFAGSTLLLDSYAKKFFTDVKLFFQEGLILPDLRTEADSFRHLAELRGAGTSEVLRRYAKELDGSITDVINFEPSSVSLSFAEDLRKYCLSASLTARPAEADRLAHIGEILTTAERPLSLEVVRKMATGLPSNTDFRRMADFLYCETGAQIVGADTLYPGEFKKAQAQWALIEDSSEPTQWQAQAIKALFRYFAIDWEKIDVLSPQQILELRQDNRIQQAMVRMEQLIQNARAALYGSSTLGILQRDAREASLDIEQVVSAACEREARTNKRFSRIASLAWDNLPVLSGASSLIRERVMELQSWLARSRHFKGLVREFTPLSTFVDIVRPRLTGNVGAKEQ